MGLDSTSWSCNPKVPDPPPFVKEQGIEPETSYHLVRRFFKRPGWLALADTKCLPEVYVPMGICNGQLTMFAGP